MAQNWLITPSSRPARGLDIVRIVVALVLSVHSITRIINGDVAGFGEFLGSIGFPLGVALAWLITLSTLASSVALVMAAWLFRPVSVTWLFLWWVSFSTICTTAGL